MFRKTVINQGRKIIDLNKENKALYEENKDLRNENEESNLAIHNYKKLTKDLLSRLAQISVIVNKFDYKNNNSFETIRIIKELANNFEPIN